MIKMNVGIIGGTDGLGKTLVYYFRDEFSVFITGRDHVKGKEVADELNVSYIESNAGLANISDILVISVPIEHTSDVIREVAPFMKSGSVMIDVTSVKEEPAKTMAEVLPENIEYIPTHPIFGPRTTFLDNQVIVLTADKKGKWYEKVYRYLESKNMRIIETTAEKHDEMIAFTSQLAHVVSNAYIKSPTASQHQSFSAGSYRDLTRVAKLNETMWTELFLDNADYLGRELDSIIRSLTAYRDALAAGDAETLKRLLREGRERKEEIDSEWKS